MKKALKHTLMVIVTITCFTTGIKIAIDELQIENSIKLFLLLSMAAISGILVGILIYKLLNPKDE